MMSKHLKIKTKIKSKPKIICVSIKLSTAETIQKKGFVLTKKNASLLTENRKSSKRKPNRLSSTIALSHVKIFGKKDFVSMEFDANFHIMKKNIKKKDISCSQPLRCYFLKKEVLTRILEYFNDEGKS